MDGKLSLVSQCPKWGLFPQRIFRSTWSSPKERYDDGHDEHDDESMGCLAQLVGG